ncbi:Random slug protein 5, partial [Tetrabaena socialis]
TAQLLPAQAEALAEHRRVWGLEAKGAWAPAQLADSTEEERRMVEAMRERLVSGGSLTCPEDEAYCTDLQLLRYLRARDHHMDKALHMYLHSLQWRRGARPWALSNPATAANKLSSDARIVGWDLQGRVVVYSSFAKSADRTPEHINIVFLMEKANLCVNAGSPGSVVWVNHFGGRHKSGFGWRDCSPAFAWTAIDIFSNHYPECLATMIIVDPPSVFFGLWKVVHPLLPEKTARKGDFIHSSDEEQNAVKFGAVFGPQLAAYLLQLIKADAKMIIVDPPSVFFGLWKVVHPLLPEKTARKGDFIHSSDEEQNAVKFGAVFGPQLAAYLLQLIKADAK